MVTTIRVLTTRGSNRWPDCSIFSQPTRPQPSFGPFSKQRISNIRWRRWKMGI